MFSIQNFPYIEEFTEIADEKLPYAESITKELPEDLHFFNEAYDFNEKSQSKKTGEKDGFVEAHKQPKQKAPKQQQYNRRFVNKRTTKKTTKRVTKRNTYRR